jgi:hypothetical protein
MELTRPERNTLTVSMQDVESHNEKLAHIIYNEYFRYILPMCLESLETNRNRLNLATSQGVSVTLRRREKRYFQQNGRSNEEGKKA